MLYIFYSLFFFKIGTLMESAWTLSETCRFRVQAPLQFDCADNSKKQQQERKISFNS